MDCFLSGRYVHTYPIPMTPDQQQQLIVISEKFGVDDYELLYIGTMVLADLIATIVAYVLIMKLWRFFKVRHQSD
ncbi:protein of unknown function [Burkholderia multivorans]